MEMTPEAKQARAEYQKEWRRKNADKCRKYKAVYWERRAAKMRTKTEEKEQVNAD